MPPKKQQKPRKKKETEDDLMLGDSPYYPVQLEEGEAESLIPPLTALVLASMSSQAPPSKPGDENYTKKLEFQRKISSRPMPSSCREQARAQILDMKLEETDASSVLTEYIRQESHQNDAYKEWHKSSGAFVAKLGQQRSSLVDETSKNLNMAAAERINILRQFLKEARIQVEKSREEEKLATDASSLIRHYKSLLIGTYDNKGRERKRG